jgi:benzoate/toluate 1,2-dioxygenase beta subunit
MGFRYDEIRDFLYREARLLDDKAWDEWLTLYCEDVEYWMPAWDDDGQPTDNPNTELSLMYYARRDGLEDRVFRVKTGKSAASTPLPRTSHNLSKIEIVENDADACVVRFNWLTLSVRYDETVQFFGVTTCRVVREQQQLRIKHKKILLKNDYIRHVVDFYQV